MTAAPSTTLLLAEKTVKMTPQVAIIVPCFNHGEFIKDTIASIQKCDQTLYELIIVNDGSTDPHTLTVLKEFEQAGIRVEHQKNGGPSAARNKGIQLTNAPYILPVDADNLISEELIVQALAVFRQDPTIDVVYSDAIFIGEMSGMNTNLEFNVQRLILENYIDMCAVFKRSKFMEVGGFDQEIVGIEDWDLWVKFCFSGGKFQYIKEPLYSYRFRKNSLIRKDPSFNKMMKMRFEKKHPEILNFLFVEQFIFQKFSAAPLLFTAKLFIRKYAPSLFKYLMKKGYMQPY